MAYRVPHICFYNYGNYGPLHTSHTIQSRGGRGEVEEENPLNTQVHTGQPKIEVAQRAGKFRILSAFATLHLPPCLPNPLDLRHSLIETQASRLTFQCFKYYLSVFGHPAWTPISQMAWVTYQSHINYVRYRHLLSYWGYNDTRHLCLTESTLAVSGLYCWNYTIIVQLTKQKSHC